MAKYIYILIIPALLRQKFILILGLMPGWGITVQKSRVQCFIVLPLLLTEGT
jgi:hypothetical protein